MLLNAKIEKIIFLVCAMLYCIGTCNLGTPKTRFGKDIQRKYMSDF